MTKRDQVAAVARVADITNEQARRAIDAFSATVVVGLLEDGRVALTDVGVLTVRRRGPRRVPLRDTGTMIDLPPTAVVRFKPAPALIDSVKERYP